MLLVMAIAICHVRFYLNRLFCSFDFCQMLVMIRITIMLKLVMVVNPRTRHEQWHCGSVSNTTLMTSDGILRLP